MLELIVSTLEKYDLRVMAREEVSQTDPFTALLQHKIFIPKLLRQAVAILKLERLKREGGESDQVISSSTEKSPDRFHRHLSLYSSDGRS